MTTINATDRDNNPHVLDAYSGGTLMEVLRDEGLGVEAICGGQCACATCHCFLEAGWFEKVGNPGEDEQDLLSSLECYDASRSRLACQVVVNDSLDGLEVTVAPDE